MENVETITAPLVETGNSPIKFTQRAVKELKRLAQQQPDNPERNLRVGVKGGGCSGMTYILEFDQKKDDDQQFCVDNLDFIIDFKHLMYLADMIIDYPDGLDARGFIFHNPNASQTCGCGTSFGV